LQPLGFVVGPKVNISASKYSAKHFIKFERNTNKKRVNKKARNDGLRSKHG
jgi:hypothetical protein